jgi:hypothetical protein
MKQLTEYKKNGYEFKLIKRDGDIAIFLGEKITEFENGWKETSENWEVIHIQSHQGREIHGKHFEPAEFPPSNEQWGTKVFACVGFLAADKRFHAEIEKRATPEEEAE